MVKQSIPSFNAGELSPLVMLRTDLAPYRNGCRVLRNMTITPYGGVRRRSGTFYLGNGKVLEPSRLIRFQYSTEIRYTIELGDHYLRVWESNGAIRGAYVQAFDPLGPGDDPRYFPLDIYRSEGGNLYRCVIAHEETNFADDLAAGKWAEAQNQMEFYTPYLVDELWQVQFCQVNAEMRFVHPAHPPYVLRIEDGGGSYFREIEWEYPPLMDENLDKDVLIETTFGTNGTAPSWASGVAYKAGDRITYTDGLKYRCNFKHTSSMSRTPATGTYRKIVRDSRGLPMVVTKKLWTSEYADAAAIPGQEITLTCTGEIWRPEHVGAYWEISKSRQSNTFEVSLKAISSMHNEVSSPIVIQGRWAFSTYGTWDGTFILQRSLDRGDTWEDIRSWESDTDRNVSADGEQEERCLMRLKFVFSGTPPGGGGGTATPPDKKQRGVLEAVDGFIRGVVRISQFVNSKEVKAVCVTGVDKVKTSYWAEGSWSSVQGYPRTVASHDQRVVYGGNRRFSQNVWASRSDRYEYFRRSVEDDGAWTHSLASDQQNSIQWMISAKGGLLIGTTGAEWVLASSKEDTGITPTNVRARRHSGHGSEYLPAILVHDATLFMQRGGRKLREMAFSFEADGYVTQDLTILSEHITKGGIVEMAYQQKPEPVIWCVTGEGVLLSMTYERGQKVAGWVRHETDGHVWSVAVMSTPGEEDEVWILVQRSGSDYLIERFAQGQYDAALEGRLSDIVMVDSAVTHDSTAELAVPHFSGKTVDLIADGSVLPRRAATENGRVRLDQPGDPTEVTKLIVGLPYESVLEPVPLEIGMQDGSSQGRKKRMTDVTVYFHASGPCKVASRMTSIPDTVTHRQVGDQLGSPPPLFSGPYKHKSGGGHTKDLSVVIRSDVPMPLGVLAVVPEFSIND